jgi:hypothetical protein
MCKMMAHHRQLLLQEVSAPGGHRALQTDGNPEHIEELNRLTSTTQA